MVPEKKHCLMIFGLGFAASAVAERISDQFEKVIVTTRSAAKTSDLENLGFEVHVFDGITANNELQSAILDASHILVSIGPDEAGDPVLNACQPAIQKSGKLQWLGYFSTVGVYGDHDGKWVDEETPCKPVSKRSMQRVEAENNWLAFANELNQPLAIFRLSGIYGPGRNAFVKIEKNQTRRLVKKDQVFNRIHRDDIAQACDQAINLKKGGIFNVTDDEPAPPQDVVAYAHQLYGTEPPPEIDFETADLTPMARSFYGENKRVSNQKSKTVLGMKYTMANYRDTLNSMWESDNWRQT